VTRQHRGNEGSEGSAVMKNARRVDIGMILRHTQARSTGATVTVERTGPGSWIEQEPGYMTMCLSHSTCVLHYTRRDAFDNAAAPEQWCGDCELIADGKRPRIAAKVF
jgi:hypothetical protein